MNSDNKKHNASVKKLAKSQVEITGSIAAEIWEKFRNEALKNVNESVNLDGFRKGQIPENILVAKVGEMVILEEMAELALPKAYMDILIEHQIDAIGRPQISVTKLAKGNPLEFKAVTAVVPEAKLPDYRKLASEENAKSANPDFSVSDQDVADAIERINKLPQKPEGFEDTPEFREKLKGMLAEDKKAVAREKNRLSIADAIIEKTPVELPDIMIESELARTEAQFKQDIERMGVKLDDYMKHAKKTIDDIRKEWLPHAEKKAKLQLILNKIAVAEKLQPSDSEIEEEVSHILSHYKDADRERARVYAETVLTNEKVFQFLESQK